MVEAPIALHGGGEAMPGDERVARTLLERAAVPALERSRGRGAAVWGAGAGAMALGAWCPTPDGGVPGLGLVPGLVVVPHFRAETSVDRLRAQAPAGLGVLGLAERTGLVGSARGWRRGGRGGAARCPR